MKGCGDGSEFPEELQPMVSEPTVLPFLLFTCNNQGVSAQMTGLALLAIIQESFQRPPVAESWYFKTRLTDSIGSDFSPFI